MSSEIIIAIFGVVTTFLIGLYGHIISSQLNKNSKKHFEHSEKLANDKIFKELFTEFNKRYDKLNDTLAEMKFPHPNWLDNIDIKDEYKIESYTTIIDFFNLCAEEYFWYKEGRINGNIWSSWSKGMNDVFKGSPLIQNVWEKECKNEGYKSYYIDNPNEFFSLLNK